MVSCQIRNVVTYQREIIYEEYYIYILFGMCNFTIKIWERTVPRLSVLQHLSEVNNTIKLYKAVLIHIKESDFYKYFKSDLKSFVIVTPNSIGSILRVKCGWYHPIPKRAEELPHIMFTYFKLLKPSGYFTYNHV